VTSQQPVEMSPAAAPVPTWWLEQDELGVTAKDAHGAVGHVEVVEDDSRVRLVFWLDERVPHDLRTRLARTAFEHPALVSQRAVSVALPHHEVEVLQEARAHLANPSVHVAGVTCLLEGRVR